MPLRMNYGGILQNYALQTVFRDLGHSPITFRMDKKEYWGWIISSIKAIVRFRQLPVPPWVFRKRFSGMERFVDQYINVTRRQDFFLSEIFKNISWMRFVWVATKFGDLNICIICI